MHGHFLKIAKIRELSMKPFTVFDLSGYKALLLMVIGLRVV